MINQFLKAGGVKTLDEFYSRFPTEQHFHNYMAYGGMYQTGGGYDDAEPVAQDYPDFRSFKAAHDQWQMMSESPDMSGYSDAMSMQGIPANMVQTPNNATISAVNKFAINPYSGLSVADFLALQGKASGYKSRKKLAKSLGINDYKGSSTENALMLQMLQQNASALNNYDNAPLVTPDMLQKYNTGNASAVNATDSIPNANISKIDSTGKAKPDTSKKVTMPDKGRFVKTKDEDNGLTTPQKIGIAAGLGLTGFAGATTYAIKNPEKLEQLTANVLSKVDKFDKFYKDINNPYKGMKADEILQAIKNRNFKLPTDFERLRAAGMLPKDINIGLRGMQFPEGAMKTNLAKVQREQVLKATVDAMQAAKAQAMTYANRFKNAKPIIEEIKQTGRTANSVAELKQAGLTTKEALQALKNIDWTQDVSKLAKTAEAVATGTKGVKAGLQAAEEVPGLLKFLKLFKEQGGEYAYGGVSGQNPHPGTYADGYSGTYSAGNYFPNGGSFMPQPMMMPGQLPEYMYGKAMYGAGMAYGGSYDDSRGLVNRGPYEGRALVNRYAKGGSYTKGSVHEMDRNQIQELINQGYNIEYL